MPEDAVTFVNSTGAFCADSAGVKVKQIAPDKSIGTRMNFAAIGQSRRLQVLLECGDMISWRSRLASVAAFYMYFG
jgi:hypothetical protein